MIGRIGFMAGADLYELGSEYDVELFFDAIRYLVAPRFPDLNWDVVTDRLYKRYLKEDELDQAQEALRVAERTLQLEFASRLATLPNADQADVANGSTGTAGDVFRDYFEKFRSAVESAKSFKANWGEYVPLKIGRTDIPEFAVDRDRPTNSYDALVGRPLWSSR